MTAPWRLTGHSGMAGRVICVGVALFGAGLGVDGLLEEVLGARRFAAAAGLAPGSLDNPAAGPRRYEGTLHGRAQTTPSGQPAVLWVASVSAEKRKHMAREVCFQSEVAGLWLQVGERRAPLVLPPERIWLSYASPSYALDSIAVDAEVARQAGSVPSLMRERCRNLGDHAGWDLTYREARLVEGASVTVGACHDGSALGPCPGGASFVAPRGLAALLLNMRDAVAVNVAMVLLVAGGALLVAGFWALRRVS